MRNSPLRRNVGTSCWSVKYDLELKFNMEVPDGSDKIQRHVYQLRDVQIGAQLPADLFDLRTFTIAKDEKSME
jgi:hypothetical protein